MNTQIVAILIGECGKLIGSIIRNRAESPKQPPPTEEAQQLPKALFIETKEEPGGDEGNGSKATDIATGCVPCAIGHLGTCTGLLNEANRFAKSDGVESEEVIDRANMCLDELNTMERVDLRPEMIASLPEWEKELANEALVASRTIRHGLEGLDSASSLESLAASTQTVRTKIGRSWFKQRIKRMNTEEKEQFHSKVIQKLENLVEEAEVGEE